MADIDVRTEGIRTAFAYNEALQIDLVSVRQHLTSSACSSQDLPGCMAFVEADRHATDIVVNTLTRADQTVKGLRKGAEKMANLYDETDAEIKGTMDSISPRDPGLPQVDPSLELAQQLNQPTRPR